MSYSISQKTGLYLRRVPDTHPHNNDLNCSSRISFTFAIYFQILTQLVSHQMMEHCRYIIDINITILIIIKWAPVAP